MSYIYALKDPNTNEIRYIGKATDKKARLYLHIKEGLQCHSLASNLTQLQSTS